MMFWYGNHMGGWGWGLMTFSSIVFWALVVFVIVLLVRYFSRAGQRPPGGPSGYGPPGSGPASGAEHLLAERYARGEIDEDEYQRRLATLRGSAGQPTGAGRAGEKG